MPYKLIKGAKMKVSNEQSKKMAQIEKELGKKIFPVEKKWLISGIYFNEPMKPEIEPVDSIEFVELLEYLKPDLSFLKMKKLEAMGIWDVEIQHEVEGEALNYTLSKYTAVKTLNVAKLFDLIDKV